MANAQIIALREELTSNLVKLQRFREIRSIIGEFMRNSEQTRTILNRKIAILSTDVADILEYRSLLEEFFSCVNYATTETLGILVQLLDATDNCEAEINAAQEILRALDDSANETNSD